MKISEYARFKRCLEWYSIDPDFRNMMESAPFLAVSMLGYGKTVDPDAALTAIRGILFRSVEWETLRENPYYRIFWGKDVEIKNRIVNAHRRESFPTEETFRYLNLQRNRCRMESAAIRANSMVFYYPFAIELSSGCSVQCPFCAFEPKMYEGYAPYTEENRKLFVGILEFMKEIFGTVSGFAPCYLATEPFDNPDYELFVRDYEKIFGTLPQTTTATADKNADRIKAMMRDYGPERLKEFAAFRFSVRSIGQYRRIAEQFAPEELLNIEVLANNPESVNAYSDSGKAVKIRNLAEEKKRRYSINCVAGLRIILPEKRMEWIEPELPDEQFSRGYRVRERCSFEDAESFRREALRLMGKYAAGRLPAELPLEKNANAEVKELSETIAFCGDEISYEIPRTPAAEKCRKLLDEYCSLKEILEKTAPEEEEKKLLIRSMEELFDRGYIRIHTGMVPYRPSFAADKE